MFGDKKDDGLQEKVDSLLLENKGLVASLEVANAKLGHYALIESGEARAKTLGFTGNVKQLAESIPSDELTELNLSDAIINAHATQVAEAKDADEKLKTDNLEEFGNSASEDLGDGNETDDAEAEDDPKNMGEAISMTKENYPNLSTRDQMVKAQSLYPKFWNEGE